MQQLRDKLVDFKTLFPELNTFVNNIKIYTFIYKDKMVIERDSEIFEIYNILYKRFKDRFFKFTDYSVIYERQAEVVEDYFAQLASYEKIIDGGITKTTWKVEQGGSDNTENENVDGYMETWEKEDKTNPELEMKRVKAYGEYMREVRKALMLNQQRKLMTIMKV